MEGSRDQAKPGTIQETWPDPANYAVSPLEYVSSRTSWVHEPFNLARSKADIFKTNTSGA
ncbi:MAG: hypothetical protein OEV49_16555 [candidate division Zixibacteria bacterium]|nr:hypothetical protein [candidate division Zixibacteria bacterium]MDH3936924.1 hypothetical protein [candidate division Zixibacteria bacterium]MDH4032771.1 hypothetical protein [candidate division Zixibacteria bacterium]